MAIGNVELMNKCFFKHSRMGTARMKLGKEKDEEGKKNGISIGKVKWAWKTEVPTAYRYLIKI